MVASRLRVHLDTDIGGDLDDLCALAYLLGRPDVEVVGVTTCSGQTARRAGYARYVLDLAGRPDIPVAAGASGSLGGYRGFRGEPGLPDEATMWPVPIAPVVGGAADALALLEMNVRSGATVVGVGTFTNLAMLAVARPGLLERVPLVLLGGYVEPPPPGYPRWGPEVDWNVQQDQVAARILLTRLRPTLVPLHVSIQTSLREVDLAALASGGAVARLIAMQATVHARDNGMTSLASSNSALPSDLLNFQYDPLACAIAVGWTGAKVEEVPLTLESSDGWLVQRRDPGGSLRLSVVTAVDAEAFRRHWLETVASEE